eukprot:NODE_1042_length_2489_cov_0.626778.p1 type:complete len:272 gc:universal NODE_1042_length_2489_cov_0.626778:1512-2327(+)
MFISLVSALVLKRDNSESGSGDATFYELSGLTACGTTESDNDYVVAVPAAQFGYTANSNLNPSCQRCIKVKGPAGEQVAKIRDRCGGCQSGDVDMSPALFKAVVGDFGIGRAKITWVSANCDGSSTSTSGTQDAPPVETQQVVQNPPQESPVAAAQVQATEPPKQQHPSSEPNQAPIEPSITPVNQTENKPISSEAPKIEASKSVSNSPPKSQATNPLPSESIIPTVQPSVTQTPLELVNESPSKPSETISSETEATTSAALDFDSELDMY